MKYRETKRMEEKMASDMVIIEKKAEVHKEKYKQERYARLMKGRHRKERNYFREKESIIDDRPHVSFVLKGSFEEIIIFT